MADGLNSELQTAEEEAEIQREEEEQRRELEALLANNLDDFVDDDSEKDESSSSEDDDDERGDSVLLGEGQAQQNDYVGFAAPAFTYPSANLPYRMAPHGDYRYLPPDHPGHHFYPDPSSRSMAKLATLSPETTYGHSSLQQFSSVDKENETPVQPLSTKNILPPKPCSQPLKPLNKDVSVEAIPENQREFDQLEILYRARGKRIEELQDEMKRQKEDVAKDIRILKHKVTLAEGNRESLETAQSRLQDAHEESQRETKRLASENSSLQNEVHSLRGQVKSMEEKLRDSELSNEALHEQLVQMNSFETLKKAGEQQQFFIESLKSKQKEEVLFLKEKIDRLQAIITDRDLDSSEISSMKEKLRNALSAKDSLESELCTVRSLLEESRANEQRLSQDKFATTSLEEELKTVTHRLEESRANEQRLNQINDELQQQVSQIFKDVDEEKQQTLERIQRTCQEHYENCKEKMREELLNNFVEEKSRMVAEFDRRISEITKERDSALADTDKAKELYLEVCAERDNMEDELTRLSAEVNEFEHQKASDSKAMEELKAEIDLLKSQVETSDGRLNEKLLDTKKAYENEFRKRFLEYKETKDKEFEERLLRLQTSIESKIRAECEAEFSESKTRLTSETSTSMESLHRNNMDLTMRLASAKSRIATLEGRVEDLVSIERHNKFSVSSQTESSNSSIDFDPMAEQESETGRRLQQYYLGAITKIREEVVNHVASSQTRNQRQVYKAQKMICRQMALHLRDSISSAESIDRDTLLQLLNSSLNHTLNSSIPPEYWKSPRPPAFSTPVTDSSQKGMSTPSPIGLTNYSNGRGK